MAHGPTLPAHTCTEIPSPPGAASDHGSGSGGPSVEVEGQRFRVPTPRVATQWLPDTPSHRHLTLVWCRWLGDAHGKPLFTVQA